VYANSIRWLLTAYDEIENLEADLEEAKEAKDEQASHHHYGLTGITVHNPMQADRIQELETELSRLEAEARSRKEELQSSAQAYNALNTELGKAQQEQ
jgi:chromosome segregation ATPase